MRKYRNYSDNDVIENSKKVSSIAGLLKELGLKPAGGNYIHMKKTLQRLNINTTHWGGKSWNKNAQLKNWQDYVRVESLKPHLLKLRGNQCEMCFNINWLNNPIPIEVHHIDGNRTNNNLNNLQLLCCNCHALTKTWRGRTIK